MEKASQRLSIQEDLEYFLLADWVSFVWAEQLCLYRFSGRVTWKKWRYSSVVFFSAFVLVCKSPHFSCHWAFAALPSALSLQIYHHPLVMWMKVQTSNYRRLCPIFRSWIIPRRSHFILVGHSIAWLFNNFFISTGHNVRNLEIYSFNLQYGSCIY